MRTDANPLSTIGVCATRASPATDPLSPGSGISRATVYAAPKHDVEARKSRRVKGLDRSIMAPPYRDSCVPRRILAERSRHLHPRRKYYWLVPAFKNETSEGAAESGHSAR